MNIKIPDYFSGFGAHSSTALQQAQKAQETASQRIEDLQKNKSDNIYQQQADTIREERDLHDIDLEIANEEKKIAKKEAKDKLEDQMKQLTNTYDAETAKEMLSSNLFMKTALQVDGQSSDASSSLEINNELTLTEQNDILQDASTDTLNSDSNNLSQMLSSTDSNTVSDVMNAVGSSNSGDKIIISDASLMQQRKMVADLYHSGNVLP